MTRAVPTDNKAVHLSSQYPLFIVSNHVIINLPSIFRNKELTSLIPPGLKVKVPTVSFRNESTIKSRHLFNHNKFSKSLPDSDNIICACKDIEYAEFINNDVGHVVTGNMKIFKHPKLIKFAEFGPKFREPVSIDFDKLDSHCCTSVLEFVKKWSNFENIALSVFNGWYDKFKSLI